MKRLVLALAALLAPAAVVAQDLPAGRWSLDLEDAAPPLEPIAQERPSRAGVVGAAWCAIYSGDAADSPGCDVGVGVALQRWHKLAAVAVVGTETLGAGLAWVAHEGPEHTIAVSVGVVARYDELGVDADSLYPAIGATLSFAGRK